MAGTPDALQEGRDRARRTELADQIHIADIDAQFERCGGDQHPQATVLEPLFGIQSQFLGQAAVMRRDRIAPEAFGQMPGDAFGQAPGVDEHQRGAVRVGQFREAVVEGFPGLAGHHRFQRIARQFQRQIPFAHVTGVDDGAGKSLLSLTTGEGGSFAVARGFWCFRGKSPRHPGPLPRMRGRGSQTFCIQPAAAQERGDLFDGFLRGRQSDALDAHRIQCLQTLQ